MQVQTCYKVSKGNPPDPAQDTLPHVRYVLCSTQFPSDLSIATDGNPLMALLIWHSYLYVISRADLPHVHLTLLSVHTAQLHAIVQLCH